jgi:hypothetical protein
METHKLIRLCVKLVKLFGVLAILGIFIGKNSSFDFKVIKINHLIIISPYGLLGMISLIIIYILLIEGIFRILKTIYYIK